MADNYLQFSEIVPRLTAEEEQWLRHQLEVVWIFAGQEYAEDQWPDDHDPSQAQFIGCRAYRDLEGFEPDEYVGFNFEFGTDDDEEPVGWGRHLWVYADEGGDLDRIAHLVQKFLGAFRPSDCWSLTYATTCSRPRVGEFGGGAVFVTATEIAWQNAYEFVEQCRSRFGQRAEVPRLIARATELGVEPDDLDDAVHDAASGRASSVNNGGLDEQIAFLVEQNGVAQTEQILTAVAAGKSQPPRA